ncbi:MAG: GNAT family N-acetyltransferase [Candidatus Hodarchaeales archaeon]
MANEALNVKIRSLSLDDLPKIKQIEKKILFSKDQEHIEISVPDYIKEGPEEATLGAEIDGELIGFLIGRTSYWEYGNSFKTGWIVAMGILPSFQGHGIGKILGNRIINYFKKEKVRRIKAIVDWDQSDLIAYFKTLGFSKSTEFVLHKDL